MTFELKQDTYGELEKCATGIWGLDEITNGGLPRGRTTLVCGAAGCGKTVLGMEFLVQGATKDGEHGLFLSFEETTTELEKNFRSMGFDLSTLCEQKKIKIAPIELSGYETIVTGSFSLEPLLIRVKAGIEEIGAKRIVLDTMDALFSVFTDTRMLRNEVTRLFNWFRESGITAVITGERGENRLTRYGFEEYVSDCVVVLDHRVEEQTSKRRLRVIKYRGSGHSKDEYPFLIDKNGFSVFPITSSGLNCIVGDERISTGVEDLDEMFGGKGYFKGSTVLTSGKAGSGKSSLAASFVVAACSRGEKTLYFAFEESEAQIARNMRSIGMDIKGWQEKGLLSVEAFRPTSRGMEEHLMKIVHAVDKLNPTCVVIDPITSFLNFATSGDVRSMLTRVLDHLKNRNITLFLTSLTQGSGNLEETEMNISSLADTWIALQQKREDNMYHRELYIIKSRGMNHSHEMRQFIISDDGIFINDPQSECLSEK
jgi:circadian clock protein KaiC